MKTTDIDCVRLNPFMSDFASGKCRLVRRVPGTFFVWFVSPDWKNGLPAGLADTGLVTWNNKLGAAEIELEDRLATAVPGDVVFLDADRHPRAMDPDLFFQTHLVVNDAPMRAFEVVSCVERIGGLFWLTFGFICLLVIPSMPFLNYWTLITAFIALILAGLTFGWLEHAMLARFKSFCDSNSISTEENPWGYSL